MTDNRWNVLMTQRTQGFFAIRSMDLVFDYYFDQTEFDLTANTSLF